jgi:hypothetical protein
MEGFMTLQELTLLKKEFEEINLRYRQTFSSHGRLELVERVMKLMSVLNLNLNLDLDLDLDLD